MVSTSRENLEQLSVLIRMDGLDYADLIEGIGKKKKLCEYPTTAGHLC